MIPKIRALLKQIESGKLKSDKAKLLYFIINNPDRNTEHIKSLSFMKWQTATARLSDLQDMGVIFVSNGEERFSKWRYEPDTEKQKIHAKNRRYKKYMQWKKKESQFKEFV